MIGSFATTNSERAKRPPMRRTRQRREDAADAPPTAEDTIASVSPVPALAAAAVAPPSPPSFPRPVLSASDREHQCEELEVLRAVYDEQFSMTHEFNDDAEPDREGLAYTCRFEIQIADFLKVELRLPFNYPSQQHPEVYLHFDAVTPVASSGAVPSSISFPPLPAASSATYAATLETMFRDIPCCDEVVVFQYVEFLKEHVVEAELQRQRAWQEDATKRWAEAERAEHAALAAVEALQIDSAATDDHEGAQRVSSYDADTGADSLVSSSRYAVDATPCPSIVSGAPLTDRKSTFQAHVALVRSPEESRAVLASLYTHNKIARATHNMWAYVLKDASTGIVRRENDDDGEDQAGSRLAHLLQLMQATNVMVVVSRWYGGIQLGPDRFKHINNVARLAVEAHMVTHDAANDTDAAAAGKEKKTKQHAHKR